MGASPDDPHADDSHANRAAEDETPVDFTQPMASPANPAALPKMSRADTPDDNAPASPLGHAPPMTEGYQITRLINRGGQGAVYQAIQNSTRRKVAVKVLLESWADSPSARRRFEREVELVAHLKHPNIITVFDSGTTVDGRLFYVMDYVHGDPITRYVRDRGLGLPSMLTLFATVCDAVNHAHQKGVIHRDLKPSNILIDSAGQPHVLDFGLAKAVTERFEPLATISGQVLGTPAYMSPEQAGSRLDSVDTRSDVYCLGVILYELLTGGFPYPVTGALVDTARHIEHTAPALPSVTWTSDSGIAARPGPRSRARRCPLDSEIETIALKALDKDRDRRYQSAGDLARDLRNYLAGRPIEARRDSTMYILKKALARHRAAALVVLGFVLLLAVSSVVFFLQRQEARSLRRDALVDRDRARDASTQAHQNLRLAQSRLAQSLINAGDAVLAPGRGMEARRNYLQAWELQRKLAEPQHSVIAGMLLSYRIDPPPLMGDEGARPSIGGLTGHRGSANRAAFLPDGRHALSCGADRTIRLWDMITGREIRQYNGHTNVVLAVVPLPGGRQFVSASLDKTLLLWDVASGAKIRAMEGHTDRVLCAAVLPDGRTAVSGAKDGTIRFWDLATAKQTAQLDCPGEAVSHIAVSPDGKLLLACSWSEERIEQKCRIWNLETEQEENEPPRFVIAQFMPEGALVFGMIALYSDSAVLWDCARNQLIRHLPGHTGTITDVKVTPDGKQALSGDSDYLIKLWDLETGHPLRTLAGHNDVVRSVDFGSFGIMALSSALDGNLKLWDCRPISMDVPIWNNSDSTPYSIAFSPDGRLAATGSGNGRLRVWDVQLGAHLLWFQTPGGPISAVAFSPDGRRIVGGCWSGEVVVMDLEQGRQIRTMNADTQPIIGVAFSADGNSVLVTSSAAAPSWWSIDSAKITASLPGPKIRSFALAVSPDRTQAAAITERGIALWSLTRPDSPEFFEAGRFAQLSSLAFSGDGKFLVAGNGYGHLWLFDTARKQVLWHTPTKSIEGVGFLFDNQVVISAGSNNEISLWDRDGGRLIRSYKAYAKQLCGLGVSPDQMRVLTAANDQRMALWDFSRASRYIEFEARLPQARAALDKNPADPAALVDFAQWHMFRGTWWWAADLFEESRAAGGEISSLELARCYARLGRFLKARAEFQRAKTRKEAPDLYLSLCLRAVDQIIFGSTRPTTQTTRPPTQPPIP